MSTVKPNQVIRVAVIGLGAWGQCHAETYAALPGVEIAALCDADPARLAAIARQHDVSLQFTDCAALWQRDDIDLVSVVTPENLHRQIVVDALRSGKHVLVEKAVATEPADAHAMAAAAHDTGRFLVPGHILRFDSRYAEVKRQLDEGAIGDVVSIFSRRSRPQKQFVHHSANHTAYVQMPHDIDLALWWAGSRVTRVRAVERCLRPELRAVAGTAPDVLWANLEFANGIVAVLHSSWLLPSNAGVDMGDYAEIIGSHGVLKVQTADSGFEMWSDSPASPGRYSPDLGIHHRVAGRVVGALREELGYLCDCIRGHRPPTHTSFADAVHGVEVAHAVVSSATSGQDIVL